jgi:ABC-type proline/glycine betaine transport system substrate-binding protein
MKRFKSILCASLLALAVSSTAFAGDIYSRSGNITNPSSGISRSGDIYSIVKNILDVIGMLP